MVRKNQETSTYYVAVYSIRNPDYRLGTRKIVFEAKSRKIAIRDAKDKLKREIEQEYNKEYSGSNGHATAKLESLVRRTEENLSKQT